MVVGPTVGLRVFARVPRSGVVWVLAQLPEDGVDEQRALLGGHDGFQDNPAALSPRRHLALREHHYSCFMDCTMMS